ncbi:hypothetical protein TIFTF001_013077 [Ficus carica]|uniref:C2 domain-containing protein n=1 Tax=Ficus carica TaxID=3494 RepID=A0AA87ZX33_FICCA|nr:hypothetical protein TIFTF001_013077 [Ficus carica]
MDYRAFDIYPTSMEDLKPQTYTLFKSKFYAVVSLITATSISRQTSPIGESHGGCKTHSWDYPMRFYADESKLQQNSIVLKIQLRRRRALCMDKDVGEIYVSLKDLYDQSLFQNGTVFISCPNNNNFGHVHMVVTSSSKYKVCFSFAFGSVFRGAVRRNISNGGASITRQLQPVARRNLVSPSAPYIGTISYHDNYEQY